MRITLNISELPQIPGAKLETGVTAEALVLLKQANKPFSPSTQLRPNSQYEFAQLEQIPWSLKTIQPSGNSYCYAGCLRRTLGENGQYGPWEPVMLNLSALQATTFDQKATCKLADDLRLLDAAGILKRIAGNVLQTNGGVELAMRKYGKANESELRTVPQFAILPLAAGAEPADVPYTLAY